MKKLFFALWPTNKIRKQIDKFNQSIHSTGLKKVTAENLHITLVFLGNVDAISEAMIRKNVKDISFKPFVLYFDRLAFWKKPQILCISTLHCDPQLLEVVDAIKSSVKQSGIETEKRIYKPHITLARKARKLIDIDILDIEWPVHSFCLVESCSRADGVHYQVLDSWDFNSQH
jgi:2'-5' RNA ligase